jgi:hypothetical protein
MPIKPPNLDDRRYEDIVAEARRLIPQYTPEWTNLNDADPGMTLVQLFAWMTEMTIYRLNRVPDKTYIHFLNFIGEERRRARPSVAPVTFDLRGDEPVEVPPFQRVSTRAKEGRPALDYLSGQRLTVHDCTILRVMPVRGGKIKAVRELPFSRLGGNRSALVFGGGNGVGFFDIDPLAFGPDAYTPHQFLYVGHDDFRLMARAVEEGRRVGHLELRRKPRELDPISMVDFFQWEYPTAQGWKPVQSARQDGVPYGLPERALLTTMPEIVPLGRMGVAGSEFPLPPSVNEQQWWIRGRLDYERWLATRLSQARREDGGGDLTITWADDRGGEARKLNNWSVRASGRALEFFLQDAPLIRGGWSLRLSTVDRELPAGRGSYFPRYRWSYRRGEIWEPIPDDRVRVNNTEIVLTGPMTDMARDGFNLRAERLEAVFMRGLAPDLELDLKWTRPVEVFLFAGDDPKRVNELQLDEAPWSPFQLNPVLPPSIGRRWYIGSDLFENRQKKPVRIEIDIAFELNGEPQEEPIEDYRLQLTYRAQDNWRVVYHPDQVFAGFTLSHFDEEGAKKKGRRRVVIEVAPADQLSGLARHDVGGVETTWLRLELVKSNLTGTDEKKNVHPLIPRIYGITLSEDKRVGMDTYEQPLPNPVMAQVDHREANKRLSRVVTQADGRLGEYHPFFHFVDLRDEALSLYLQFDKPLPRGLRHAIHFRTRGESYLPEGTHVEWELLERRQHGRTAWRRLVSSASEDESSEVYELDRTGELSFALPEIPPVPADGFWLRARFVLPPGTDVGGLPGLPPITHIMLNTVEAVNLDTVNQERFSGLGVPNQVCELRQHPIFLHPNLGEQPVFSRPELFTDIAVTVEYADGTREPWYRVDDLLTAEKDSPAFSVDSVDGTLHFGNGIHGRMVPVGTNNIVIDTYQRVPGAKGNVGAGEITVVDGFTDRCKVLNLLPASGGRDAETIDEIVERAPSLLTSRDRAVTRQDFEVIAKEASGEVARAACVGKMGDDGTVDVVILPHRRPGELIPDPFLSSGMRDHVESYLARRCLINVQPKVRLATFLPIDVALTLRLRPNANILIAREQAELWVRYFLDPYVGGLDGEGWPFGSTLFAQDFGRMVSDIAEVRHVVDVRVFDQSESTRRAPGWEEGEGARELALEKHDLVAVRRVRIRVEEGW